MKEPFNPLISLISGLLNVSLSPQTNYFYLGRPQNTSNNLNNNEAFTNLIFVNLKMSEIVFDVGKDGCRTNPALRLTTS